MNHITALIIVALIALPAIAFLVGYAKGWLDGDTSGAVRERKDRSAALIQAKRNAYNEGREFQDRQSRIQRTN